MITEPDDDAQIGGAEPMIAYRGEERRTSWRFDRRFSLDTLIAAIAILGAIYAFANSVLSELRANYTLLDKRVSILEERSTAQKEIDSKQDLVTREGQARLEQSQQRIEASVNELVRRNKLP